MNCSKPLSITINAPPADYEWWQMEEAAGNRVDGIMGKLLIPAVAGTGSVDRVPGKVNFAAQLSCPGADQAFLDQVAGTGLDYTTGQGITLCGWFNYDVIPDASFGMGFFSAGVEMYFGASTAIGFCFLETLNPFSLTPIPTPSAGAWHFFTLEYDPAAGATKWEIDRSGVVSTVVCPEFTNGDNISLIFELDTLTASNWILDEIACFPMPLNAAQKDYLWNSGNGRTIPIVLPP